MFTFANFTKKNPNAQGIGSRGPGVSQVSLHICLCPGDQWVQAGVGVRNAGVGVLGCW